MKAIPVYIGYDPREAIAFHTCANSIIRNSSRPVAIIPVALNLFKDYNETHTDGSNHFIYTRFLVPHLQEYTGWAIFIDGDMIVRGDIAELWERLSAQEVKVAALSGRIDTLEAKVDASRSERNAQYADIKTTLTEIRQGLTQTNLKVDDLKDKVAEAHGAAKFGKWLAGTLIAMGAPAALFAWYSHGGGK